MPSTSKKQHHFMEAVAHNPSFAKKAGIPQSVGKEFSAADKGKTFNKGGATMMSKKAPNAMSAMMARRRMGAGMAPSDPMGMKKYGKVRRFDEGGITDGPNKNIDDATRARALAFVAKNKPSTTNYSDEEEGGGQPRTFTGKRPSTQVSSQATQTAKPIPSNETNTGAVTGRVDKVSRNMPSAAQKEENTERLGEGTLTAATLIPAGRLAKGAYTLNAERLRRADQPSSVAARKAMLANRRSAANAKRASDMEAGFKKGGAMKYAKGGMAHGGMHKMPNKKMMKNSAMKEGGMPMKDGKPAFLMSKKKMMGGGMAKYAKGGMPMKDGKPAFMQKKMMGGGMAKYAKGGGIESRGKTKGTVIRMASGGSVSSASRRADGIAQRGKTRG